MPLEVEYVQPKPVFSRFVYSVKFICDGTACTAINVENLTTSPVTFTKRAAAANPQGEDVGPVSPTETETLGPLQALQIDCQNIWDLFGSQQTEGFVVIDSPTGNLQVTAVHRSLDASVYWYMAPDAGNFVCCSYPRFPTEDLTGFYPTTVNRATVLSVPPSGYDVLVLSDVGASFDLASFGGDTIITFDSSVAPLMFWFTGDIRQESAWAYHDSSILHWLTPVEPDEPGASSDAGIFNSLSGQTLGGATFTRRNDILEAAAVAGIDDVIVYDIEKNSRTYRWVHMGPHFGFYAEPYSSIRLSQLIKYALDLLLGSKCPVFPPVPATSGLMAEPAPDGSPDGNRNG